VKRLAAGTHLGPYEIVAPLGAGGMGEVHRARDPRLGREVAIKVLPEDLLLACLRIDPRLAPLHELPRFQALVKRLGGE